VNKGVSLSSDEKRKIVPPGSQWTVYLTVIEPFLVFLTAWILTNTHPRNRSRNRSVRYLYS